MRYYPKNRIKPGQVTTGGEFLLDGTNYTGNYYKTFDDKVFTGSTPYSPGANRPLTLSTPEIIRGKTLSLVPYYPKPSIADYGHGYFIRYFIKKRNENTGIIEISKPVFDKYENKSPDVDFYLYQVIDVFWKLTGPLRDDRTNRQYPRAGIIDTNKRVIETKEKEFKGIVSYIGGNYIKFSAPS